MKQLETLGLECLKSGEADVVTAELMKAEELYRSSRGRLVAYILANQSDEKLLQIYGSEKDIEDIRTYDDGEHLHQQALEYYARYVSLTKNYSEAEIHTMDDTWVDAAGGLYEYIRSLFPDYEYEPWNVPRPEMPEEHPESAELRLALEGFDFFETSKKRKPTSRQKSKQDFDPSIHGVARHVRNN